MIARLLSPGLFILIIAASLLASDSCFPEAHAEDSAPDFSFTILHSNDLHSHEDSYLENGKSIGGIARIAHLIKSAKAKSDRVLAIDAGDIFQGTPYFEEYHGTTDIECLNKAGYDIYTVGNHEFDDGSENLAHALKLAKFDVISANLDVSNMPQLSAIIKPSVVKTIAGERIGFVGVITPSLSDVSSNLGPVKLKATGADWMHPVQNEITKLKAQGINKIILVSHCGIELEKQMAEALPDVDAIIGGHSHTRLDKPAIVKHEDGSLCLVVQTGSYGRALGRLNLVFDRSGRVVLSKTQYHLINITDRIFDDPDVKAYITEKGKPFANLSCEIAGFAEAHFDNRFRNYPCDSPIGDLVCDAIASAGKQYGATISLQNRGGIRSWIDPGPISCAKVRELLPFNNRLKIATVTGEALMAALENSVSGILGARFLDVHGLKVAYDPGKEPGHRIIFAYAQNKDGHWEKIESAKHYRIALNDYSFNGGECYDFKKASDIVTTDKKLSYFFQQYLEQEKRIRPAVPSRLVAVTGTLVHEENGASNERRYVVRYPDPGAEFSIVTGRSEGVEFLPKVGPVPLFGAELSAPGLKLNKSGEYRIRKEDLARKEAATKPEQTIWFSIVLKSRGPENTTRKIISTPIKAN